MTFSDAELVRMWPRIPFGTCSVCRERGPCTWTLRGFHCLCDPCREAQEATE